MGLYKEEYVVVQIGLKPRDPIEITINCPDKVGLSFDLVRIVFEFGLYVTKADFATDGSWCFVVFWVTPLACPSTVRWPLLKQRLEDICPNALAPCWLPPVAPPLPEFERGLQLLVCSSDRRGLLHDVVQKTWKMELIIHKAQVSISPEGKAISLFLVSDNRNKLPWSKERAMEVKWKTQEFLGGACNSVCEVSPAGPEHGGVNYFPVSTAVAEEIFCDDAATFEQDPSRSHKREKNQANPVVTVDNSISPVHSVLQISCKSRKGLLYDCLRIVKDLNLKVAHGRIPYVQPGKGNSELCLFVVDSQGRTITDEQEKMVLVQRIEEEIGNPVRIKMGTRGTETELLVANPIEKGGRGRPRVLHDVTEVLSTLDINIFKANIGRYEYNDKHWEIYQFLLVNKEEPNLTCTPVRNRIVKQIRQELLGRMQQE